LEGWVDAAHLAVVECDDQGCCGVLEKFISVGEPHHPTVDYVGGWISDVSLATPIGGTGKLINFAQPRTTMNIKLSETGWPVIAVALDAAVIPPMPAEIHAAALHSYAHAQRMMQASFNYLRSTCGDMVSFGGLRPVGPSGGLAGWAMSAQIVTDW
jgi:hypothetical protein